MSEIGLMSEGDGPSTPVSSSSAKEGRNLLRNRQGPDTRRLPREQKSLSIASRMRFRSPFSIADLGVFSQPNWRGDEHCFLYLDQYFKWFSPAAEKGDFHPPKKDLIPASFDPERTTPPSRFQER
jgi:hypothetical protein